MTKQITDFSLNWLQRVKQAWTFAVTWVNGLFTLVALYVMSDPTIQARLMPFIPDEYKNLAGVILPIATFWVVQKAKEIDKARVIAQTRIG